MTSNHDHHERLAGDILPWERQPEETEMAWAAFNAYLHSERRKVTEHGPTAKDWSARYSWGIRAHEFDIYMARVDLEDAVRYRRRMNERHRQVAAVAQGKVVAWLGGLDPARMSVADATRLLDVAVRIEREATGAVSWEDLPDPYSEPAGEGSLEQRLLDAGLDVPMSELARFIHERLRPPRQASADAAPRQAQADAAPLAPEPTAGQTSDDTPPWLPNIWGDR